MRGAFLGRRGHPLAKRRSGPAFDDLLRYPIASTPLSDEVARTLVERYGPRAHPDACVTLRCDEVPSLVRVRDVVHAAYLSERGMPGEALSRFEPLLAARAGAPGLTGARVAGLYARVLRMAGHPERAKVLCERVRAGLSEQDRVSTMTVIGVELEHAAALLALGDHAAAAEELERALAHHQRQVDIARQVDWVYDFALPPLALHAIYFRTARCLKDWIAVRPANALTVLDTHDGIGISDIGADASCVWSASCLRTVASCSVAPIAS